MKYSPLYSPYGAYELKATYQRNMFKSNCLIVSFFVLVFGWIWIYNIFTPQDNYKPVQTYTGKNNVKIIKNLPPPPKIIPDFQVLAHRSKYVSPFVIGIPKPIPDEGVIDENVVIPSRDQLKHMNDESYKNSLINFDAKDGLNGSYPDPDDFIEVDQMPQMIYRQIPDYPDLAKNIGVTGTVIIQSLIDKDGSVLKVNVKQSSGLSLLDYAAVQAGYKNLYTPAILDKNPIRIWVVYKVVFELD